MNDAYHALLYLTVTGEIVNEIPMTDIPSWLQQINADGSWSINTAIGPSDEDTGLLTKDELWPILQDDWRYSVAIVFGSSHAGYVCQAGPIISWQQNSEDPAVVQLGGSGIWALLRATLQVSATWPGTDISDGSGDTSYTGSLQYIAQQILANAVGPAGRNPLPVDIVMNAGGSDSRSYLASDLASVGQRLQDITQDDGGPDILLKPYFADSKHIRHQALVGNPTLTGTGAPLRFDYPRNLVSVLPSGDGSKRATSSYVGGNGTGPTRLWSVAVDTSGLEAHGWPSLDYVDTSKSDQSDPSVLQQIATADQALYGRQSQTMAITALMDDANNPFGSYDAGTYAYYNIRGHSLLPDGETYHRILGLQNGTADNQVRHILEGSS